MVALNFNAQDFEPATEGGSILPLGCHLFEIKQAEATETKSGGNGMLVLHVQIVEGPHTGTIGNYRLNLWHSNPQTVEIARRQLSALCYVTGRMQLNDTTDLESLRFIGKVVKQKVAPGAEDKGYTEIRGVYDTSGVGPQGQGRLTVDELSNNATTQQQTAPAATTQQQATGWGQQTQQATTPPAAQTAPAAPAWGQQPPASAPANVPPPPAQQQQQQFTQNQGQAKAPWEQ